MISEEQARKARGSALLTRDGDRIGTVGEVYLDDRSERPAWVTVRTGLLGTTESFVPLDEAELTEDGLVVPYDRDRVTESPRAAVDEDLSPDEEAALYEHYGLAYTDHEGAEHTEHVPAPRFRKHVVTDEVSTSVPVTQQHVEDGDD